MSSVSGFLWPLFDVLELDAIGVVFLMAFSFWLGSSRRIPAGITIALGAGLMTTGFASVLLAAELIDPARAATVFITATMLAIAGLCLLTGVALRGLLSLARRSL